MENYTILIADDDEDDYKFIREAFDEIGSGHEFEHVLDGEQLLDNLRKCDGKNIKLPDLIILDINMPKMDGITALEIIKSTKKLITIPVFMHSTSADVEQINKCISLGVTGFVTKDHSLESLINFAKKINAFLKEFNKEFLNNFVKQK